MKKRVLFLFVILISVAAFSQSNEKSSLLWKISGKGLEQPSYIFGTIHIICKADFFFPETLKEKFNEAKNIYMELDMDDPSMMMKAMQLMLLPGDKTLKDYFTDADYKKLETYVQDSLGMPMQMFEKGKPIMLISLLSMKELDCKDPESYEQYLMGLAQEQHKDIKGLETMEQQVAIFDSIPDKQEGEMIMKMIEPGADDKNEFNKMIEAYKEQDIDKLYNLINESPDIEGASDLLLKNRNANWIKKIEEAIKTSSCFFAVGSGHLGGNIGLIHLLREKGYSVTPVPLN